MQKVHRKNIRCIMKVWHIRSLEEFVTHHKKSQKELLALIEFLLPFDNTDQQNATVHGYSYPAGRCVDFQVDFNLTAKERVTWRESLICPVTGLNNRLRASIHLMDIELAPYAEDKIFISEQVTPLYSFLKDRYPKLVGSEFLGDDAAPGSVNEQGIRHEDLTRLSFEDDSIDYILSFDCLEHFPDFELAFAECYRSLKPGGRLLWSIPFIGKSLKNVIRAKVESGTIRHILPPEYHGDPVNPAGCLCFTHFGWEMLDQVRACGFSDAYALVYGSLEYCYLDTGFQIAFAAVK